LKTFIALQPVYTLSEPEIEAISDESLDLIGTHWSLNKNSTTTYIVPIIIIAMDHFFLYRYDFFVVEYDLQPSHHRED
jgi:hypothetical protein